jgi:thiol-disulfide isomerase/thioredoxin
LDRIAEIVSLNEITIDKHRVKDALFRIALQGGGSVTIKPVAVTDSLMIGESPLIGKTSVPWHLVSALDFGVKQAIRESALASWKLRSPPPLPNATTPADQLPSPLIGKPAPEIELEILEDKYVQLADLKGQVVMLDFWATWCGPCLASMPTLMDIATEFRDQGVEFIAVNQQEDPEDVLDFLATRRWDLQVALDADALISRRYGVAGIPFTVIIDKEGIVRHVHVGAAANLEQTLRAELQELLTPSRTGNVSPANSASIEPT